LPWFVSDPDRIPAKSRRLVERSIAENVGVSASSITTWEIAMLTQRDRLELTMPADSSMAHVEALPWLSFVPVDNRIALRPLHLGGFTHRDPADRMIIATTLVLNATLITGDKRLRSYSAVRTAWD
jgi:PIN domain nuclease of toxin-antitoxin system